MHQSSAALVPAGDVLCLSNESRHGQSGHSLVPRIVSYKHMPQGPYTSGHLKFKAIQDFSGLFEKLIQEDRFNDIYILLGAVNEVKIFTQLRKQWR